MTEKGFRVEGLGCGGSRTLGPQAMMGSAGVLDISGFRFLELLKSLKSKTTHCDTSANL